MYMSGWHGPRFSERMSANGASPVDMGALPSIAAMPQFGLDGRPGGA